ncbi:MAG: transposase [Deltaproteobacteria bacterium]|nr:transposase [Deltaproteobacteria bacterium]
MPRKPRIDFGGAWHHVMHRGARRAPIFKEDAHCFLFLECLEKVVAEFELEVHAYSLMPNHYHLLVRSRHGNLSGAMRKLNATYTQRVNLVNRWDGPVFRGRFHSQLVNDETRLPYILAYIHLNPLRANLATRLHADCWTSHRAYVGREPAPDWLSVRFFLDAYGGAAKLHEQVLELHRGKRPWPEGMSLESGWMRGVDESPKARRAHKGKVETRFVDPQRALALVAEVTGASPAELRRAPMGPRANPARRFAVWALKRRTTLTHEEIGRALSMSAGQVAHVLRRLKTREEPFCTWIARCEDA